MWLFNWFYQILLDEQGQDDPAAGGEGESGTPGDGESGTPGAGEGEGTGEGEGGQGEKPPATPAYGDFGDTPKTLEEATELLSKIFDAHSKLKPDFETLKGKTTATERNLALTRQALESSGIKAEEDEDGNIRLKVVAKPTEKQARFSASHKALFEPKVLEAITLLIQDLQDQGFETRQKAYQENTNKIRVFNRFYDQATGLMFGHFPQLDPKMDTSGKPTNADFDKAFHDKVLEKVKEKYTDGKGHLTNPQGELLASLEVAQELGINAQVVANAEKTGFERGKSGKKVLGPAGPGGKGGQAKRGKLSQAEYFKLSPKEREEYDKQQVGIT